MGSRFSALNNTDDAIVIRNESGTLIDSLTYFSSWGGSKVSLERRSYEVPAIYSENWGNSPASNNATPGMANQILPDNSPPELQNAFVSAPDTIQLVFDERIIASSATNQQNFSASPAIHISEIQHHSSRITLILGSHLSDGQSFTLTIMN